MCKNRESKGFEKGKKKLTSCHQVIMAHRTIHLAILCQCCPYAYKSEIPFDPTNGKCVYIRYLERRKKSEGLRVAIMGERKRGEKLESICK